MEGEALQTEYKKNAVKYINSADAKFVPEVKKFGKALLFFGHIYW